MKSARFFSAALAMYFAGTGAFAADGPMPEPAVPAPAAVGAPVSEQKRVEASRALELIQVGETYARTGHWQEAALSFGQAVNYDPDSCVAYYDLGVALAHLDRYGQAAEAERNAIRLNEKYTPAYIELGWILAQLRQFDEAERLEKQALALEPENGTAHKNLAAIRAGREAGTAQDKAARALAAGLALYREGKLGEAKSLFEEAIRLHPRQAAGHINLGVLLGDTGDHAGQIREEKLAVQLDPKNATARLNLAWGYARKGQWALALPCYQKAIELDRRSLDAQIGQGLALYHTNKPEAGIAVLKLLAQGNSQSVAVRTALGRIFLQEERLDEASALLSDALRLEPENTEATFCLAAVKFKQGDRAAAIELYKTLSSKDPGNQSIRAALSKAQAEIAKQDANQAKADVPPSPDQNPGNQALAAPACGEKRQLADR